jgi:antitoxin (DNA-binding transcriptional repressor) of toxin-antitoxin stability system
MTTVGAYEAKTRLPDILDEVAKGERIGVSRQGVPAAIMNSPNPVERPGVREAIERIKERRKGNTLGGLTIRELIEEGRRY